MKRRANELLADAGMAPDGADVLLEARVGPRLHIAPLDAQMPPLELSPLLGAQMTTLTGSSTPLT